MKKFLKASFLLVCLLALLILPYIVFAQGGDTGNPIPGSDIGKNLHAVGTGGGYTEAGKTTLATIAGTIVSAALGFLGILFIVLIIYGGFLWMTDQGNEEQVAKAKTIIKNAVIGLILIIAAYGIYSIAAIIIHSTSRSGGSEMTPAPEPGPG